MAKLQFGHSGTRGALEALRALSSCQYLHALPPCPGGKRRLLPGIFGVIKSVCPQTSWPTLTFADPFLGGGAVALAAKAFGFRLVVANDLATRSVIVGRALLENSTVKLSRHDVLSLFQGRNGHIAPGGLLERLPPPLAKFLAGAWSRAGKLPQPKDDLARLLLIKWLVSFFPMGLPSATDSRRVRDADFDRVTYRRLHHYPSREKQLLQPSHLLRLASRINASVFPGEAVVCQTDAFDFLSNTKADVAYLDPAYGGTQSYESAFRLLDEFLGDDGIGTSAFSSKQPPIDELLIACSHIPVVVLSLNNSLLSENELTSLVARRRQVERVVSMPYPHYGPLATARKNAENREFLVLATSPDRRGAA